jgi:ectoine hydroxylase-related dioxygenase (phytanoyl-CoA dioxygenase family)
MSNVRPHRVASEPFASQGIACVPQVLSPAECEAISRSISGASPGSAGTRGLLSQSWCRSLVQRVRAHPVLSSLLPAGYVAVQCTYFEKSSARNWLVPVHQDLSIPVASRVAHSNLRGWSEKEGTLYVQALVTLLEQLVAIRVHIDSCSATDGPLRVVPASHLLGRIEAPAAASLRRSRRELACLAEPGTLWVMRPLLLHASSKSSGSSLRRVLHFLFGPAVLPLGLQWQHVV